MKNVLIFFLVVLTFMFTGCKKKNYPSDIPRWLKEKIDVMNKEASKSGLFSKARNCHYGVPRQVEEYTDGSSTFYWIGSGYGGWSIYNYPGDKMPDSYPQYVSNPYNKNYIRLVWIEDCH